MSKSIGNVISPYELVARYGTDATRYLLLRHVHPFEDTDITWERLDEWYTANLVNGLGNLVSRVTKMAESYGVSLTMTSDANLATLTDCHLQSALDLIWNQIGELDAFIQREEPFKKIKVDEEAAKTDVHYLLTQLEVIGHALAPFMPATSAVILEALKTGKKPENLFPRLT